MINIFKILNFKIFLLSFILGIVFIYLKNEKKHVIIYPTPYNKNKFQFVDKADNCFKYEFEHIKCPSDSNKIKKIPVI
tara:strand:+ start:806 stop:1039 length:234 start_codon:yes stop_codon:yes gene_type:complete